MDVISYEPFWRMKNGLMGDFPTLAENLECDVVVVGGGISGALVADELLNLGLDIVLIEKYDIGAASTSGSTALLQYEIDTPLVDLIASMGERAGEEAYISCCEAITKMEKLAAEIGHQPFTKKKSAYVASSKKDLPKLKLELAARKKAGIAVEWLEQKDIEARFSFSRTGAILSSQAAELDPYLFTYQLMARNMKRGLRVFDRTEMKKFSAKGEGAEILTASGHRIRARKMVMANGYESALHLPRGLVKLNSSFAMVSKPLATFEGWHERCLLWETARPYLYFRTTQDGRALVGGMDEKFRNPKLRDALIAEKSRSLAKRFMDFFPHIPLEKAYSWAGTFGETKDGLPYIGTLSKYPNCYFSCGFGGNGITYSALAAEIIRDAVAGKTHRYAYLFLFDRKAN